MSVTQNKYAIASMNEPFSMYLIKNFQEYCATRRLAPNMSNMLNFLLSYRLFTEESIRHYVVLNDFRTWIGTDHFKNKTQTIKAIAERYDLHENTIWNILKDHKHKFE